MAWALSITVPCAWEATCVRCQLPAARTSFRARNARRRAERKIWRDDSREGGERKWGACLHDRPQGPSLTMRRPRLLRCLSKRRGGEEDRRKTRGRRKVLFGIDRSTGTKPNPPAVAGNTAHLKALPTAQTVGAGVGANERGSELQESSQADRFTLYSAAANVPNPRD